MNRHLGIATSASWNVIQRPWRTTLAPILIGFSREVSNDRFGSEADVRRGCFPRPELGVERKQSDGKRTLLTDCRLLGVE